MSKQPLPPDPYVEFLRITPAGLVLLPGDFVGLTGTAHYSDGKEIIVTFAGTWQSSDSGIATVDTLGVVTAISAGSATISFTYGGATVTYLIEVSAGSGSQPVTEVLVVRRTISQPTDGTRFTVDLPFDVGTTNYFPDAELETGGADVGFVYPQGLRTTAAFVVETTAPLDTGDVVELTISVGSP